MSDPAADAARAAAAILASDLGAGLPAEVEAALAARNAQDAMAARDPRTALTARDARQRPNRYLDPVSLGSLIVSIATLTWTVYNDLRDRHTSPTSDAVARKVHIVMRERDTVLPDGTERIIEAVAIEITRHNSPHQ